MKGRELLDAGDSLYSVVTAFISRAGDDQLTSTARLAAASWCAAIAGEQNRRRLAAFDELLELARKVERIMSLCVNPDGSWIDMPAAYKRDMLETARAAITKATGGVR